MHGSVSIIYTLIATRSLPDRATNAHFQLPITLTTRCLPISKLNVLKAEKHQVTSHLSIQTAALSKECKLRLREQFYDAFNASAPTFYFGVKATTPKLAVPGASVNVRVAMEVLPPPPGKLYNFPVPDITITSMKFVVRSYTGIRTLASGSMQAVPAGAVSDALPRKETFKETAFAQVQTPTAATFVPQKGGFDDQVCVATITLPREVLPSFKTYNAWRGYRLECAVRLKVAGKEVEARFAGDLDVVEGGESDRGRSRAHAEEGMSEQVVETIVKACMGA